MRMARASAFSRRSRARQAWRTLRLVADLLHTCCGVDLTTGRTEPVLPGKSFWGSMLGKVSLEVCQEPADADHQSAEL